MHCADTSFLLSYYAKDANSQIARDSLAATHAPLMVHILNDFEMANALRALKFRDSISTEQMTRWLRDYHADKSKGILVQVKLKTSATLRRANSFSEKWTETSGNRSYDILLVAAASLLGATHFWSFDKRQRKLAEAEGMIAMPCRDPHAAGAE